MKAFFPQLILFLLFLLSPQRIMNVSIRIKGRLLQIILCAGHCSKGTKLRRGALRTLVKGHDKIKVGVRKTKVGEGKKEKSTNQTLQSFPIQLTSCTSDYYSPAGKLLCSSITLVQDCFHIILMIFFLTSVSFQVIEVACCYLRLTQDVTVGVGTTSLTL